MILCQRSVYKVGNEEINKLIRKLPISDPMLQGKAIQFDKDLGNTQFKASKDWLEKFCKCNNVAFLCKKW